MKSLTFARTVVAAILIGALGGGPALAANAQERDPRTDKTYTQNEIVDKAADFFGVASESVGKAVQRIFAKYGKPNGYITGNEGSGAIGVGLRYGEGNLYLKNEPAVKVYWQGPSVGFDIGANASKAFTLVYNLPNADALFQRFPGVEGSYYFVAGIGVNYQQAGNIILAPMRTGVGLRAGANIGYLSYTRERNIVPF